MTPEQAREQIAHLERTVAALNRQNESLRASLRNSRAPDGDQMLSAILRQATEKIVAATRDIVPQKTAAPVTAGVRIVAVDGDPIVPEPEHKVCGYRAVVQVDDRACTATCLLVPGHTAALPGYAEHVLAVSSAAERVLSRLD